MLSFGMLQLHTGQRLLLVQLNVGDLPRYFDSQNLRVQLIDFHRFCPPARMLRDPRENRKNPYFARCNAVIGLDVSLDAARISRVE